MGFKPKNDDIQIEGILMFHMAEIKYKAPNVRKNTSVHDLSLSKFKIISDIFKLSSNKGVDLFISKELLKHQLSLFNVSKNPSNLTIENTLVSNVAEYCDSFINEYNPAIAKYIDIFKNLHPMKKIAILHAHGDTKDLRTWGFWGNTSLNPLQKWIDENENKYSVIYFLSCNPGNLTLSSKSALLVIPDKEVGKMTRFIRGADTNWTMHYLNHEITSMTIKWEMALLNKIRNNAHLKSRFSKSFEREHYMDNIRSDFTKEELKYLDNIANT